MVRMPKSLVLILGLLCFGFASCIDSEKPLSDPKESTVDSGLLGLWRLRETDSTTYYHIGQAGEKFPDGMLRVIGIRHDKNKLSRPEDNDMLIFTTTLGKNKYLNIAIMENEQIKAIRDSKWDPSMTQGYFIYKYELNGDKLAVAGMDSDQKEEAIKAGKIKGIVEEGDMQGGGGNRITDTTENLVKFIAAADQEKLFPSKDPWGKQHATLERVK